MNIFEHYRNVDEQIAKLYINNHIMFHTIQSSWLNAQGLSFSGNQPLSATYRDGFGNIIDSDNDGIPDALDTYFGDGPVAPWDR